MNNLIERPFLIMPLFVNFVSTRIENMRSLIKTIVIYSISLFYGWLVLLGMAVQIVVYRGSFFLLKKRDTVPPCLIDEQLGKHAFVSLKDVKLHYVSNGNPEKPMMLFIHGFPEFWFSWRHQLKAFSSDYYVVALDMRGYGDSEKPSGKHNYTVPKIVSDIQQFLVALNQKEAIVVGHDWGGAIAWSFASAFPEMVSKLIIMNAPHPTNFYKVLLSDWKQFLMSWYMFFFQLPLLPEFLMISRDLNFLNSALSDVCSDEELEAYKYIYSKPGAVTCPLNYYRKVFFTKSAEKRQVFIQSPTLVIWGENDFALSLQLAHGAAKYVKNSFTLRLIENGSHFIQLHKPEIVNRHIREFLDN